VDGVAVAAGGNLFCISFLGEIFDFSGRSRKNTDRRAQGRGAGWDGRLHRLGHPDAEDAAQRAGRGRAGHCGGIIPGAFSESAGECRCIGRQLGSGVRRVLWHIAFGYQQFYDGHGARFWHIERVYDIYAFQAARGIIHLVASAVRHDHIRGIQRTDILDQIRSRPL